MSKIIYTSIVLIGIALFFSGTDRITSETGFCVRCHSMENFHRLREGSVHFRNARKPIECMECHAPTGFIHRRFYKIKAGAKDIAKTILLGAIPPDHFNDKMSARPKFVFDDACLTCHQAGLERSSLPARVPDIHAHIRNGLNRKMHCVDCHGGMEHGRNAVFNWPRIREHLGKKAFDVEEANLILGDIVNKACLACHLKEGQGLGGFAFFNFDVFPVDYLPVKIGIRLHDMPPTRTFRAYAQERLDRLEKLVE